MAGQAKQAKSKVRKCTHKVQKSTFAPSKVDIGIHHIPNSVVCTILYGHTKLHLGPMKVRKCQSAAKVKVQKYHDAK